MPTCLIQSCPYWKLGKPRHPDITLHGFPSSARRVRSWLEQTGHRFKDIDAFIGRILETRKGGDYQICSAHFANDSYTLMGDARVLKVNAMPTIFPAGTKLIHETRQMRTTRRTRLAGRRKKPKPPRPSSTSAMMAPALTKTDVGTQTEDGPSTAHQVVQTEELFSYKDQRNNSQGRCLSTPPVTCNDEHWQGEDKAQNVTPATQRCDEGRCHVTKRILNLTLEIIYLLTGERPDYGGERRQSPSMKYQTPFLTMERNEGQKILDVTNKIIDLLTPEESLEGHKDLYKDVLMKNRPPLTSPDSFLAEDSARSSKPFSAFNDNDEGPHFSKSQCGNLPRAHHLQHPSVCVKEEIFSAEEHLPCSNISTTTCHGQIPSSHVKEELLAEEHLQETKLSPLNHQAQATTIHTKERQLSVRDHLPKSNIPSPTHHTQPTTIHVKEGPLSDEDHLHNPKIFPPTYHRQSNTIQVKKGCLSDEHFLNPKICALAHHRQPITIHIKEGPLSDEEHLHTSKIPTPVHQTEPSTIHIKEGCLSTEEHLPHEMNCTTIIIDEDSRSSVEEHLPHSAISISQSRHTFAHARKGHHSSEEEHFKYSKRYLPSSPIQYIPVRINDDFLARQQPDIPTHPTEDLVEEVPILYEDGLYADSSAAECDGDLSGIPVNCLPAGSQRTFLSNPDFSERSLFCPECGKSFTDRARVEAHLHTHWNGKPYCCSVCLKGFRSKSKLVIHQMMHSGEKPYACSICGKRFAQNAYLQRHIRGHTGEKPFPCSICGKCFACRSDMVKHEFTHTGARPHPCALCGKRFTKKSHLNRHMRIHTGEKPFCCPDCGRSFGCNSDMVSHQRIHQGVKPFSCSECGKRFLRKQDAQRHQTIHR